MEVYRVTFIGHRVIDDINSVEARVEAIITRLLREHDFVEFYVGNHGDFDRLTASAIKRTQKRLGRENSSLILVLPYRNKDVEYYAQFYDDILFPLDPSVHPKAAITQRNRWMVKQADLLIAYVEPNRTGGAAAALRYAEKEGIDILQSALTANGTTTF